jgi:hypothetical protein
VKKLVYVTGDTHGDRDRLSRFALKGIKPGDTLIVCGDFGFIWNDDKDEQKFIRKLAKRKYNICFIDGTHDNFTLLNNYEQSEWNGGKVHKIYGNVYHLMRGQVFTIEGKTFFTMGGGESPDIDMRNENETWDREEIPSKEDLLEGIKALESRGGKVDYIITHEPPAKIKSFLNLQQGDNIRFTVLNTYFEELSKDCKFTRWFFGSMHIDKFISSTHVSVFKNVINAETGEKLRS